MTRHPGHGNRGQGRKGGGRESGDADGTTGSEVSPSALSGSIPTAAANPAAPYTHLEGCLCELHQAWRRIRVLEAENRILTDAMRKEIAKVRALEAELARAEIFRKDLSNAFLADARDLKVRAEKAEVALKAMTFSRDEQLRLRMKAEARVK